MKKYYVNVNGTRYEVEVSEVAEELSLEKKAIPNPKVQETAASEDTAINVGGDKIECPMPGNILKVNVSKGDSVKKGDVLFVLEAMKMENEIMAPQSGKVLSINTIKGANVNTGDVLAVIG